jgi:ribosomal biogenesis protein LAS1
MSWEHGTENLAQLMSDIFVMDKIRKLCLLALSDLDVIQEKSHPLSLNSHLT